MKSPVKILIAVFGIVTLAVMLIFFTHEVNRIVNWSDSGFVHSIQAPLDIDFQSIEESFSSSPVLFFKVDSSDFTGTVIPSTSDTLLTIDDSLASHRSWLHYLEMPHEPGRIVPITYLHNGDTLSAKFETKPIRTSVFTSVLSLQILKLVIIIIFFGLGFWVLYKRDESAGVRALAMYCFTIAPYLTFVYLPMYAEVASFQIPFQGMLQGLLRVSTAFFSSFWLLLHMYFPRKIRLFKVSAFWPYFFCFGPQTIAIIMNIAMGIGIIPNLQMGIIYYIIIITQVVAGLIILWRNFKTAENNLQRRQTKLVLYGSGGSLLIFSVYMLTSWGVSTFLNTFDLTSRMIFINLIFLFLLASPLSFVYALGKFRLLEIEGQLGRGTRYLVATLILLAIYIILVFNFSEFILANIGITSRTPTLIIAVGFALGFVPAQRRLQQVLENRFFPERIKLRNMVHEFFQNAMSIPDVETLCIRLEVWLKESVRVNSVIPVIRSQNNGNFRLVNREPVPIEEDSEFLVCISNENHPLFLDEAVASEQVCFNKHELKWLEQQDVALVLPLKTRTQVLGFLALGHKQDNEDFHPEEVQILQTVAEQVSLILDNLRLLGENVEKQRMEKELQIARQVQMGFLPRDIPESEGLDIAAISTFSLEVAGDYYDVIPRDNGQTLLAIGDVSGKGAGAALIMANLQASLRALGGIGLEMSEIMKRVNDIIFANTDPEQYITFFAGIYDPKNQTFTYVNAGHNFPLLVITSGEIRTLEEGGLILGFAQGVEYLQETVQLQPGDTIFLYTDGLSEAMNKEGEEFGEQRIEELLNSSANDLVGDILDKLVNSVDNFRAEIELEDDLTLLMARVKDRIDG
jgi:serine phosphatase RsbU (regulator of sigma subunit)